jgi:hypothetical protein
MSDALERGAEALLERGGKDRCDARGKKCVSSYVFPRRNFQQALDDILRFRGNRLLTRAVLVTGSADCHDWGKKPPATTLSSLYVDALRRFLEQSYGLNVSVVSGNLPDDDLKLMMRSKNFVTTGGGFSKLVGELVVMSGGFVVGFCSCTSREFG